MRKLTATLCLTIAVLLGVSEVGLALQLCPENRHPTTSPWSDCVGTFSFSNGDKYVGEFRNDKIHGQGTFTFSKSGNKYVGEFRNGKKHGQGTFYFAESGNKYVGEFTDNKIHGQGTIYFARSGNKYVGEFRNGKRNGQGTFTFSKSGNKYVGEFRNDKIHGQGTLTFAKSGDKYVGEFRNDKIHGQGTFYFARSGNKYVGEFRNGKKHGQGTFTFADGRTKEGIWKEDKFQYAQKIVRPTLALPLCEGSPLAITNPSEFAEWDNCRGAVIALPASEFAGDKFVGGFKNGNPHGQGTYTYASGDKYVGEYRNGKKHGQGTYTHARGDKYVGEYRNGKKHGQGTYTFVNGDKYVGEHRNGKAHGQGAVTFASGSKYVGEFRNGKKHGQGTFTFADGRTKEGIWKEGKFQYAQQVTPPTVTKRRPKPRLDADKVISASSGSGFAVSSSGHVITNHHVIKGCQSVKIHYKGKSFPATVVTYDPKNDLALLKGDFRPPTVLSLSNRAPELLQDVYVAGYPFGRRVSTGIKVTKGIISSLTGIGNNFSQIQIDAALQPGNSGGPILDDRGNVVGVAVAKLDIKKILKNYGVLPENTNFGIKTNVVRSILESSGVSLSSATGSSISKSKLGRMISDGTYYLSCWMTTAQIAKMRAKKAIFQNLD